MYQNKNWFSKKRVIIKILLCIVGILFLVLIAFTYGEYQVQQEKKPYVRIEEIQPILQAFLQVNEDVYKNNESIINLLQNSEEEYLNYGNLLAIMELFPLENVEFLQDYKQLDRYIGLIDWQKIVTGMVEAYGKKEIILTEGMILGDSIYVELQGNCPLDASAVLTEKGIYQNQYPDINKYFFHTVNMVCYEDKLLSVINIADKGDKLENVYLADISEAGIHFFWRGYHLIYPNEKVDAKKVHVLDEGISRKIVDIEINNGKITVDKEKSDYFNGKLLQISEDYLEVEGYGVFSLDENMEIYRLYGELQSKARNDLQIGYSFTDFVLENGKIVACLMMKEEDMDSIRVLIKNSDFAEKYHQELQAYCNRDCELITYKDGIEVERKAIGAREKIVITKEEVEENHERIKIVPSVLSASITIESIYRNQGTPTYFGTLEITREKGGLLLVNEVLLEDYLCFVVPSEMPASYPKEALMAQAISARTYAYGKMLHSGLPQYGAHVDDSAGFQVYNNIGEQANTTEAVRATHNKIAIYGGEPISTYYYSTSCGVGTDTRVWHGSGERVDYLLSREIGEKESNIEETYEKDEELAGELTEEASFREWIMNTNEAHYESEEGWYRWRCEVKNLETTGMEEVLKNRYENNPKLILTKNKEGEFESKEIKALGDIVDISVVKRVSGGVADELLITGKKATIKVISELNIRYVLANGEKKVIRQTGDEVAVTILPSAFIVLDLEKDNGNVTGYQILGGGFGHGVGMSQNGAKNMAALGKNHEEILSFFYPGHTIKTLATEE